MAATRPRGVLVLEQASADGDATVHEYRKADRWELEARLDGDWLHVLGRDGEQIASFRPGTYDRPEAAR